MSQLAFLGSPAMSLPMKVTPASPVRPVTASRFRRQEESLCAVSWLVAISGAFLLVGLVGMLRFELPMIITLSGAAGKGASEVASQDTTMAELQAMEEAPQVEANEVDTPEVIEVPELMDVQPEILDLPELTEALVTEDLFTVPAAPRIESVLTPVDPVKPKAQPKPKPMVAQKRSTPATTTASGTPGGTSGSGGGGGGNGAVGSGGRGKFPSPPYPSFARSRGIQGSVTLTVRVSPAGMVESATVSSGTGFSELDEYAASWVRRNWRFPTGAVRSFRLPISFKLR